jgi:hypothetical protein
MQKEATVTEQTEPFVTENVIAEYLSIPRKEVLKLTREQIITAYPYCGRVRKRYRYRLSEVTRDFARFRKEGRINRSSPSDSEPEKTNG